MYKSKKYKRIALKTVSLSQLNTMSQTLPTFVTRYRHSITDIGPKVVGLKHKMASIEEKKLRRFYKCTKFNLKTGNVSDQCFVSNNFKSNFEEHLKTKHPKQQFYCCYCYPRLSDIGKDKKYMEADKLVKHLIEVHRHRRYQCNLCLYRAISAEHVNIHQSVIHSAIHKSTLNRKQLDGKSCKILECPPATAESARKPIPTVIQIFNNHKYRRLNNEENHNKDYQCVYCNYMNESISKVVEHSVQTHPDYHILYYVPEPLVTSTLSPLRVQHFTEIDVFNPTEVETQDNRVTSTETCEAVKDYMKTKENCQKEVEELAFKKKTRVSAVQKGTSAGLSNKRLNTDSYPSASSKRLVKRPYFNLQKLGAHITGAKRLNQLPDRPKAMPKSVFLKRFEPKRKKEYKSDDSDDSTPKKVHKLVKRPEQSSLPPFISLHKTDKQMICKICEGNQREFPESQISSHIALYHDPKMARGNKVPFMCGYCRNFFDLEQDASVKVHIREKCTKKPENWECFVDRMIVTKDMYFKDRPNDRSNEKSNKASNDRSDGRPKKLSLTPKRSPMVYLSEDDYKELNEDMDIASSSSAPVLKKQSSTLSKAKEGMEMKASIAVHRPRVRIRTESSSSKGYHSSDDDVTSIPESVKDDSDESRPQPSTSCKTTTIEVAEPESEEEIIEERNEFVCLFCDQSYAECKDAVDHLETHLPEINEATDDTEETKNVKQWLKTFVKKQNKLFEDERDIDDSEHHYKCPICVKIARLKQLRPKRFRTFWELKSHFWEHTCWLPVKCLICKIASLLPNCDHLIAKHLNQKHSQQLIDDEDVAINRLCGNKVKDNFTEEQRKGLHESKFIKTNRYEPLDKQIEAILQEISDKRETKLREKAEKAHKTRIILPKLVLQPLPPLNFDDDDMIFDFISTKERQNGLKPEGSRSQKSSSVSEQKKPLDYLDLGSSSGEDSDDEPPIVIHRKRQLVFEDSDDEQLNDNNNAQNDDSDDGIEVVCEVKSESNSNHKSGSNKSDDSDEEIDGDINKVISSNDKTRDKLKPIESNTVKDEEETDPESEEDEEETKKLNETSDNGRDLSIDLDFIDNEIDEVPESPLPPTPESPTPPAPASPVPPSPAVKVPSSPIKRFKCSACNQEFENSKDVKSHSREEHVNQPIRFSRI